MQWSRIDLSKSSHQLLTSDRPIDMPLGLADPKAYISLPVSPHVLFVAAHNHDAADALRRAKPTEIVRKNNQRVIEQARKFVWGSTDSQLTFVQKHFGKLPDREILTEQQRQEAIEAARAREKRRLETTRLFFADNLTSGTEARRTCYHFATELLSTKQDNAA